MISTRGFTAMSSIAHCIANRSPTSANSRCISGKFAAAELKLTRMKNRRDFGIAELGALDDVAGTLEQESADAGDDAHPVGTGQPQNPLHRVAVARHRLIIGVVFGIAQRDMIYSLYSICG